MRMIVVHMSMLINLASPKSRPATPRKMLATRPSFPPEAPSQLRHTFLVSFSLFSNTSAFDFFIDDSHILFNPTLDIFIRLPSLEFKKIVLFPL